MKTKTKLRRCLYVGLGGTGLNVLLHTKKMFLDTYGEVPPMIGFLHFDTDQSSITINVIAADGSTVSLNKNEHVPISVPDPKSIYMAYREHFAWCPESNVSALTHLDKGAGAFRTNGRFAITLNEQSVESHLRQAVSQITNANIINNPKYELLDNSVEIHLAFSMCGGTGSGTFIPMAYIIRDLFPNEKLVGYAVFAGVFNDFLKVGKTHIMPNAYGSILDLDYLTHLSINAQTNLKLDFLHGREIAVGRSPFNAFFLLDNKNGNNDTYNHPDEIAEMLSLALFTTSGELADASASFVDNIEKIIDSGSMDIENKKAWVSGLGVCEIMVSGKRMGKLYAVKAANRLTENLLTLGCIDTAQMANAWIDDPAVNIRENNNQDNVINYLLKKNPDVALSDIMDTHNPQPECEDFIQLNTQNEQDGLNRKMSDKLRDVKEKLHEKVVSLVNTPCGVATAEQFILGVQRQVYVPEVEGQVNTSFLYEMKHEEEALVRKQPSLKSAYQGACDTLRQDADSFFRSHFGSTIENDKVAVCEAVNQYVVNEREIMRRRGAIAFYNGLQTALAEEAEAIARIKSLIKSVRSDLLSMETNLYNGADTKEENFVIDLTGLSLGEITIADEDIQIESFIGSGLNTPNHLYDCSTDTPTQFEEKLLAFTCSLKKSASYSNKAIDDVIDEMSPDDFHELVTKAVAKSMTLLKVNTQGKLTRSENAADSYYIGVSNKADNRLAKQGGFQENLAPGTIANVQFVNIGMDDRIIIYHQYSVLPAYAITAVQGCQNSYDKLSEQFGYHFDKRLETIMERERYNLYPVRRDDSEQMKLWVYGFVFGYIRNENGMYQVQSKELGDILNDNWYDLAEYRDDAFNKFCEDFSTFKREFDKNITEFRKTKGQEEYSNLIKDASKNYRERYSQIGLSNKELDEKVNAEVKKLFIKEMKIAQELEA